MKNLNHHPTAKQNETAENFITSPSHKIKGGNMDAIELIGMMSVLAAGLCMGIGALGPAIGEGMAAAAALRSIAQQPDESAAITRTLFVAMAMIESTGIYAFVIAIILIFANPFWDYAIKHAAG
jgi:F-type H+-transporting ATPase subunit c